MREYLYATTWENRRPMTGGPLSYALAVFRGKAWPLIWKQAVRSQIRSARFCKKEKEK